MKKLIPTLLALVFMTAPIMADEHVTIAIRTNQFTTPAMAVKFAFLQEHIAPKYLSDSFHGLKAGPWIKGGQWTPMTNTQGHVWMVNNFRKSELEKATYTYQYGDDGEGNQVVTNTINHGKSVNAARITQVRGASPQSAFKISKNSNPRAQLKTWGLFAIREDDEL